MATFVEPDGLIDPKKGSGGTRIFMAPEVTSRDGTPYDAYCADVFSYGISVWEMCMCEHFPVSGFDADSPIKLSEELKAMKKLIRNCRKRNPKDRWSMNDVMSFLFEMKQEK
eukprot:TRINITY_DN2012_c1_g2_i2.p2 TRINITY_DN2012_c1_g2~~TRINITY_DN2012_c1_g2_i2.p2  ORF type:complete len:112 (-),score=33.27 TRINITY_DN2012_c1_g2_i2:137-472(-)